MPPKGKKVRLTEETVAKYHEFYRLCTDLLDQPKADEFIRWAYTNGRFVPGRIQELAFENLLIKTKQQKNALQSARDDGHAERVEQAAKATCDVASQFKRLSRLWGQLIDATPSRSQTGELIEVALGDKYPWQQRT